MIRAIAFSVLSMLSFLAHAAVKEETATIAELPPPDATGLVAFLVAMVAMIGGYVWWIMRKERERKERESAQK